MDSLLSWLSDPVLRCEQEYSCQHFQVGPDSLTDIVMHKATSAVETQVERGRNSCNKHFGSNEDLVRHIDSAFDKWKETQLEQTEKTFLKFGQYLKKNLLAIPKHVVLPHDKGVDPTGSEVAQVTLKAPGDADTSRKDVGKEQVTQALERFNKLCLTLKEAHIEAVALDQQELQLKGLIHSYATLESLRRRECSMDARLKCSRNTLMNLTEDCERNEENILKLNNMLDQLL